MFQQQSGHHMQNQILKRESWKLHRGVQLDLLFQTMITQAAFLVAILTQLNWPA